MSKEELAAVPLKKGAYLKPERTNPNINPKKYDAIDEGCETAVIANDGNAYVPEQSMPKILNQPKQRTTYIIDNMLPDDAKRRIGNTDMLNTSNVVGYLDQNSHQTRDAEDADLSRYARDSLTRIGDSDQAEAQRRRIDTHVAKGLRKLKAERGADRDEITGEPLEKGAAFHHLNSKELYNNPLDVLDPAQGRNVNPDTHTEIHSMGIMDEKSLKENQEEIKRRVIKRKKGKN